MMRNKTRGPDGFEPDKRSESEWRRVPELRVGYAERPAGINFGRQRAIG